MKHLPHIVLLASLAHLTSAQLQCNVPGLCHGYNLDTTLTDTPDECLSACKLTDGCAWYSHDSAIGACIAFAHCTEVKYCHVARWPRPKPILIVFLTEASTSSAS